MPAPDISRTPHGVSIITCTKRRHCMDALFHNYSRQNFSNKELIVILNHDSQKVEEYIKAARSYPNVSVFRLPGHVSLGYCLNYGVERSRYGLIAKFDDDDYYAPGYLRDSVRVMKRTGADIVGKRAHYMQLNGSKRLLLRYGSKANRYVSLVQGATLLVKRHVFRKVRFHNLNRGECVKFCSDSLSKGYKIYSGAPSHFLAIRRGNSKGHTWIVSDKNLMRRNARVFKVKDARRFVGRG